MPDIRPLTTSDHEEWARLRQALWPQHAYDELFGELQGLVGAGLVGFGAFDHTTLVGFAEASRRAHGDGCKTAPVAWLEGIYVTPDHRRTGIGAQLVEAVTAWARALGFSELGSDVEVSNSASLISHARWGFAETERLVMLAKVIA